MSVFTKASTAFALAGAVVSAAALLSAPARADDSKEKCYGVALKGQNDCAAGAHSCAGQSTMDYDGQSFKLVAKGNCATMKTPHGMGSLMPMKS